MAENFVWPLGARIARRGDLQARLHAFTPSVDSEVMTKMRRATGKFNRFNSRI
jgi:hypothetical protein